MKKMHAAAIPKATGGRFSRMKTFPERCRGAGFIGLEQPVRMEGPKNKSGSGMNRSRYFWRL
jgi:hypothetical protein